MVTARKRMRTLWQVQRLLFVRFKRLTKSVALMQQYNVSIVSSRN